MEVAFARRSLAGALDASDEGSGRHDENHFATRGACKHLAGG